MAHGGRSNSLKARAFSARHPRPLELPLRWYPRPLCGVRCCHCHAQESPRPPWLQQRVVQPRLQSDLFENRARKRSRADRILGGGRILGVERSCFVGAVTEAKLAVQRETLTVRKKAEMRRRIYAGPVLLRLRPEPPSFDAATAGATAFRKAQPRGTPAAESELRLPQIDRATAGAARSRLGPWRRPTTAGCILLSSVFRNAKGLPPDMRRIQMSALVAGSKVQKA
jgi:hypothetical protein